MTNIDKYDLITFNALRWRMLNHEKYIPYLDEWQFSLSNISRKLLDDYIDRYNIIIEKVFYNAFHYNQIALIYPKDFISIGIWLFTMYEDPR